MGTVLKGATLVELEPANVEVADLRVAGGRIMARGPAAQPEAGDEVIDVSGRLVMPGFVSGHHHLSATLLRGAPRSGAGFGGERTTRAAFRQALSLDDAEAAAAAGGLEGLAAGTTTLFDTHVALRDVEGALSRVAHGLSGVGLRAVLAQRVTAGDEGALRECLSYAAKSRGRFRGAVGLGDLGQVSDDELKAVKKALDEAKVLGLITVAEDADEEGQSVQRFGNPPTDRLLEADLVGEGVVIAQGVHLSWPQLSSLISRGSWLVHTARSNMATQTGHATPSKFGIRGTFGTDVMPLDVLAEAQAATLRASESGQPIDILRFLANGHRLASHAFGMTVGPLREGAAADLVVMDYQPPTPLDASTLAAHMQAGLSSRYVESVMVDGLWRLWKRKPLAVDPVEIARAAREAAQAMWRRLAQ
ncbi:MAG: amidohydrolase family protein [Myxococcota bacterium]